MIPLHSVTAAEQDEIADRIRAARVAEEARRAQPLGDFMRAINREADRLFKSVPRSFYNTPQDDRS